MASWKQSATTRILRDLKEVLENPLPNVVAVPDEENVFKWHGNVRGEVDSKLHDVAIHFKLFFPDDYPCKAPQIQLATYLPHPNLAKLTNRPPTWKLALWDCNPVDNGWSCAYTVHSILIQLQAFLMCESFFWAAEGQQRGIVPHIRWEEVVRNAATLEASDCPHKGSCPWPAFPTAEAIAAAAESTTCDKVKITTPAKRRKAALGVAAAAAFPPPTTASSASPSPPPKETKGAESDAIEVVKDEWQVATGKGFKKQPKEAAQPSTSKAAQTLLANPFASLAIKPQLLENVLPIEPQLLKDEANVADAPTAAPVLAAGSTPNSSPAGKKSSKTQKKNLARGKKRAAKQAAASSSVSEAFSPQPSDHKSEGGAAVKPPAQGQAETPTGQESEGWQVKGTAPKTTADPPLPKTDKQLIEEVADAVKSSQRFTMPQEDVERSPDLGLACGSFTELPSDLLAVVLGFLERRDIAKLAATCKGLRASCGEGEIWRMLLKRDFSKARITASTSSEWKHAYLLQAHGILSELQCYCSKTSYTEEVLGFPLYFTENPRTGVVDYISLHPQLLSVAAFKRGMRATPGREDLSGDMMAVLPAYLSEDHFLRAQPHLRQVLQVLTPEVAARDLKPAHWLDVCAKLLNTAIILLIDNGVAASERAISSYCCIHRLMLALAEHFGLWEEAARRLDAFLQKPSSRTKAACPNLGWLITMLAVSQKHKWSQVAPLLLSEMLDRSVMWACKAKLALVPKFQVPDHAGGVDEELLEGVFESMRLGRGLLAFHSAFLHFVARPPGASLDQVMDLADVLYGWPSAAQVSRLQRAIGQIQAVGDWPSFLRIVGVIPKGEAKSVDAFMTRELRRAWQNSVRKGYHKKGMDFTRIQASGVSRILLKGQTYSAPPNMTKMALVNVWKWAPDRMAYLDVSVLIYATDGHLVCIVDYSDNHSFGTKHVGAVSHSGDLIEDDLGKHLVDIDLPGLGDHVGELYVTTSAWAVATLFDCKQPHTIVRDGATDMNLCEYHLEDQPPAKLRANKCVVMCRIFRSGRGWGVEALGEILPRGAANDYGPILEHIERRRAR